MYRYAVEKQWGSRFKRKREPRVVFHERGCSTRKARESTRPLGSGDPASNTSVGHYPLSPSQASVVNTCLDIVFSQEGEEYRKELFGNIARLRMGMERRGFQLAGNPSPIVPVFAGNDLLARVMARENERSGLVTSYAEYPAVATGRARFRFQMMRLHTEEHIDDACELLAKSRGLASEECDRIAE